MTYIKNSRRDFLKGLTATSVLSATSIPVIANSFNSNEAENTKSTLEKKSMELKAEILEYEAVKKILLLAKKDLADTDVIVAYHHGLSGRAAASHRDIPDGHD